MVWVKRLIWTVLAIFSGTVLYVVFSGGVVDDHDVDARHLLELESGPRPTAGSMAYDRYLPGGRQGQARTPDS